KIEYYLFGVLLFFFVDVGALIIIGSLIMVVYDMGADIAIVRCIGASPRQILDIFMVQGNVIVFVGTLIGGELGVNAAEKDVRVVGRV
ncbi:FtsX-like permease family protein, partial [Pseudomonas syringae group genomosp. 7]|uniref:FtsX-like permease family protein n=1 Tax=Pseudomonas syringae group genomosp. 7 TaxID=251699 RepID=UPI00376FED9C